MKTERDLLMETMEKAKIFKQIKKEYLKDKIIGYYYFQSFLGFSLPKYQIDFILNSKMPEPILMIYTQTVLIGLPVLVESLARFNGFRAFTW